MSTDFEQFQPDPDAVGFDEYEILKQCGWIDDQEAVATILGEQPFPVFGAAADQFAIRGSGAGKRVLLYEGIYNALGGRDNYNYRFQTIGDCVSMGGARAVDILRGLQVAMNLGQWIAETATEPLYAASRVEIGKGRLGSSDGSVGAWAAEACKTYGTLVRQLYGEYDLRVYDGQRARQWGMPRQGMPDPLEPFAKEHLVQTVSLVTTWEELRDAIASGYPVTIASNQGFRKVRDAQGFARPEGNWAHQMCVIGIDDASGRPGALVDNSWGRKWITGPLTFNQPDGSFWVDAEVMERRILRAQDSWAYSDYQGFPAKYFDLGSIF